MPIKSQTPIRDLSLTTCGLQNRMSKVKVPPSTTKTAFSCGFCCFINCFYIVFFQSFNIETALSLRYKISQYLFLDCRLRFRYFWAFSFINIKSYTRLLDKLIFFAGHTGAIPSKSFHSIIFIWFASDISKLISSPVYCSK